MVWTFAIIIGLLSGPPDMTGLATYYAHGPLFRDGTAFAIDAPVCAVDDSLWHELAGETLMVVSNEGWLVCQVRDTGYLDEVGEFAWAGWMWKPAKSGYNVAVDLPRETHRRLSPENRTKLVQVWRMN